MKQAGLEGLGGKNTAGLSALLILAGLLLGLKDPAGLAGPIALNGLPGRRDPAGLASAGLAERNTLGAAKVS